MEVKSNIQDVIKQMEAIQSQSASMDFSAALTTGVNASMGEMKFRIFNTGQDNEGNSLGDYTGKQSRITKRKFTRSADESEQGIRDLRKKKRQIRRNTADFDPEGTYTEYEKKRLSEGRQIAYKDLEFTGGLRRSIVVATIDDKKVACIINNKQEQLIAEGQEKQIARIRGTGGRVPIFSLSDEERLTLRSNTNEAIKQLYDRLFRS